MLLLSGSVRVAWIGRTSTEESQDPRLSLMRQLERCRSALPATWTITCHFFDVESGRLPLAMRGNKENAAMFGIPIPRDGGISDLLEEASSRGRRFDVAISESTSRIARAMFESLSIERTLESSGVPLFAWNETIKLEGGRSQQILQRRINQSVAEYEVYNALETSWGGLCAHVREGWNIGKPPYGYAAKKYRNPNPVKADKGAMKSRLVPDGLRAVTVTQIANWRYYQALGYGEIADLLNADLELYPPPQPPGCVRARGVWGRSTVYEILNNPKYTGYQVFNRRASRSRGGKVNDPSMWVWSPGPAHEALIPKWMFDRLTARRRKRRAPTAVEDVSEDEHRCYVLRGRVFCFCGRRLHGNQRRGVTYYICWPKANNRGRPDSYAGHPKVRYANEAKLLKKVARLYADCLLGPRHLDRLAGDLALVSAPVSPACSVGPDAQAAGTGDSSPDLVEHLPFLLAHLELAPKHLLLRLFQVTDLAIRLPAAGDACGLTVSVPASYGPATASSRES
ncbi:recombinase family protein [Streptomyces sp. NPDC050085]|uniref:recombinase family protein n=1 Tax=Streptomyces sp. NPDC050085 TaxID=3365600 RepID=UPI0037B420EA